MPKVRLNPGKQVIGMSTRERAIAGFLDTFVAKEPDTPDKKDLLVDGFEYLFKTAPTLVDEPPTDRAVNHAIMDWAMTNDADRGPTIGSMPAASIAAGVLYAGLTADKNIKEALDKQGQAQKKVDEARELEQQLADIAKQTGGQPDEKMKSVMQGIARQAKEKRQQAQELADQGVEVIEKTKDHPMKKHAMTSALTDAKEEGEKADAFMRSWGVDPGTVEYADIERIANFIKDADVGEITRLFGRYREMARQTIAGVMAGKTGTFPEVMETKDISKIFVSELAMLDKSVPTPIRLLQTKKFFETGLMGYQPLEDKTESGSVLIYNDWSGSIGDELARMINALAIAIGKAVQDEIEPGRIYELYGFDYVLQNSITNDSSWQNHLHWATSYTGGGTDIMKVIAHAIDRIKELATREVKGVDVCIISDGVAGMDERVFRKFDEVRQQIGTRLCYIHLGYGPNERLKAASDLFIHVQNTNEFKAMIEEILVQVATMIANH